MTLLKKGANTELRSLPLGQKAGYSAYRSLIDQAGRTGNISGFGDIQTADRYTDISLNFHYGLLLDSVLITQSAGGSYTTDQSLLKLSASAAGDVIYIQSHSSILYSSGFDAQAMFTAAFTAHNTTAVVHQEIGAHDDYDGYTIAAIGEQIAVRRYKGGVKVTEVLQQDFNIDPVDGSRNSLSQFVLNMEALNIYRIQYGYLGLLPPVFEVYGGHSLGWIPLHVIEISNEQNAVLVNNPHLPIKVDCQVISGDPGKVMTISTGSWYGGVIGGQRGAEHQHFFGHSANATIAGGVETPILSIRNKTTFNGTSNRLSIDLSYFSAVSDGTKAVEIRAYGNPTLTGAVWTDIETGSSYVESDISATAFSGGRYVGSLYLAKVADRILQLERGQVRFFPGDSMLITATSVNASEVGASVRWGENR